MLITALATIFCLSEKSKKKKMQKAVCYQMLSNKRRKIKENEEKSDRNRKENRNIRMKNCNEKDQICGWVISVDIAYMFILFILTRIYISAKMFKITYGSACVFFLSRSCETESYACVRTYNSLLNLFRIIKYNWGIKYYEHVNLWFCVSVWVPSVYVGMHEICCT